VSCGVHSHARGVLSPCVAERVIDGGDFNLLYEDPRGLETVDPDTGMQVGAFGQQQADQAGTLLLVTDAMPVGPLRSTTNGRSGTRAGSRSSAVMCTASSCALLVGTAARSCMRLVVGLYTDPYVRHPCGHAPS
jgi:hypothetical protein